ncbi:MAG TPA: SUF system Fe-S cluster assembly regulator [Rhodocyclaceae bacterium]|nr:SUF system Fe-S cluster assembly regulator [Rhodocyclaceae bacterium]
MLRLGKLTDYGTVITAHMARQPERVFAASELAAAGRVSVTTASKILKLLVQAGLLRSLRGARGGYALARPPGEISLAQIIDALEGPPGLTECSVREGLCAQEQWCTIRGNWQAVDRLIRQTLDHTSLADMMRPASVPLTAVPPPMARAPQAALSAAAARPLATLNEEGKS